MAEKGFRFVEDDPHGSDKGLYVCFFLERGMKEKLRSNDRGFDDFMREARAWCAEQFGKEGQTHGPPDRWFSAYRVVYFRDSNDAFAFKMRWC